MALGALPANLLRLVLGSATRTVGFGIVAGLGLTFALSKVLAHYADDTYWRGTWVANHIFYFWDDSAGVGVPASTIPYHCSCTSGGVYRKSGTAPFRTQAPLPSRPGE